MKARAVPETERPKQQDTKIYSNRFLLLTLGLCRTLALSIAAVGSALVIRSTATYNGTIAFAAFAVCACVWDDMQQLVIQ